MKVEKYLFALAVISVIVSVAATSFTYFSITSLNARISGFATSTGTANLTVEKTAIINFTVYEINWSSGRVNVGQTAAYLLSTGSVVNGNWSTVSTGLVLQNIGNANVSLDLAVGKTAAQFIGGTSPNYAWNVTNVEGGSCTVGGGQQFAVTWNTTNSTAPGTRWCNVFQYLDSNDTIRIDINLTIPYDSLTGALTDTITATATAL